MSQSIAVLLNTFLVFFTICLGPSLRTYLHISTTLLMSSISLIILSLTKIFTLDVTALYTNILNNDAMVALRCYFDRRLNPYVKTDIVLRLAELVLNLNTFNVDGKNYSQSGGMAMGTEM